MKLSSNAASLMAEDCDTSKQTQEEYMKLSKMLMAVTAAMIFAGGSVVYVNSSSGTDACEIAASCGRCGDGYCAKQCGENAKNCPRDCGVPSAK